MCDICGHYILPIFNKAIHRITVEQTVNVLDTCDKCYELMFKGVEDWHNLPDGPLRKALVRAEQQETKPQTI